MVITVGSNMSDNIKMTMINHQMRLVIMFWLYLLKQEMLHVERWIRKFLTEAEAGVLYTVLSLDKLTKEFIKNFQKSHQAYL